MPSGVYQRTPRGPDSSGDSPRLKAIRQKIRELEVQAAKEIAATANRVNLLKFVQQHNYTRPDLSWVYKKLPVGPGGRPTHRQHRVKSDNYQSPPAVVEMRKHKTTPRPDCLPYARGLRKARQSVNMKVETLASRIGVHDSTLRFWERGIYAVSDEYRAKIQKVLGPIREIDDAQAKGGTDAGEAHPTG